MSDYWTPTAEEVEGTDREALEKAVESLLPNHLNGERVRSYEDLLDDLEGDFQRGDGTWVRLDLGTSTDSPTYRAVLRLAKRVVREATQ